MLEHADSSSELAFPVIALSSAVAVPRGRSEAVLIHIEGGVMSLQTRIESLKERHAALEMRILEEDARPRPDSDALMRLKVEKLRCKEELERLKTQEH
jgi:hypothetical protein